MNNLKPNNGIRVVIDTNVLIGGALSFVSYCKKKYTEMTDTSLELADEELSHTRFFIFALTGALKIIFTSKTKDELIDVLNRTQFVNQHDGDIVRAINYIISDNSQEIVSNEDIRLCRDSKDDKILEAAIAGKAQYIVTLDNDLLSLKDSFTDSKILTPSEFIKENDWQVITIKVPGSGVPIFAFGKKIT